MNFDENQSAEKYRHFPRRLAFNLYEFGAGVTQAEKIVGAGVTQAEKTVGAGSIEIDEPDFRVLFDASEKAWTVTWKWSDDAEPDALRNRVTEYAIPTAARSSY